MTEWTAQVNDLVGGWIVTTYPHPLSEHVRDAEWVGTVIAECPVEADARLIADLLNAHGQRFETGGAEWLRTELGTWREVARNYLDEREWRTAEWFEAATERDRAEASRRDWAAEAMRLDDLLDRAARALREVGKRALTVKPSLDRPYPDEPAWTPWTRFLGPAANAAYNLAVEIRAGRRMSPPQQRLCACITDEQAAQLDPRFTRPVCAVHGEVQ